MSSDEEHFSTDLDDLLSQADDLNVDETGKPSQQSGPVSSAPRRGLFSGRTSASASQAASRQPERKARKTSQSAAGASESTSGSDVSADETASHASRERNTSARGSEQRVSKTPPKPVESPPELKPVIEGTPLPENSKFLRLACACGYRMRIRTQNAGKTVKCPKCDSPLKVPLAAASSGGTIHFRLEDTFTSKLSKVISVFDKESEHLKENKTLSRFAFRSVRLSVESIAGGRFDTERVREAVFDSGASEDTRAFELLRDAWDSEPGNLQADILHAMGRSKDPRAISFLLQLLTHHLPETRLYTVQSLAFTAEPRIVSTLLYFGKHHPDQKYVVSDSLLKMGEVAVIPLLELLSATDDRELMTDIVIVLGRLKSSKAIKPLMQLLETDDSSLRGHIAEALGLIGDPKSMTGLLPLLKSDDEKLRSQVAGALGRVPHPGCLRALIEALGDDSLEVRKHCVAALGELGDKRAAPALVPLLNESDTELRIAAAEALGRIGDQRAVPYLLKMVDDEDESVILKALGALRKIQDPAAASSVMELLQHENSRIRQRAADVLGKIGDAVIAERLEQILKNDRSEDVRAGAAKALGEIRDPGSVDVLIDSLHDAFSIRCRSIVALGEIGDDAALPSLLAMLKDPAPEIRYHAALALAEIGHEAAIKNIQPLLDDSNAMVRRGAAKALETLGQGDAQKLLGSSTQRGTRRFLNTLRNFVASISPGAVADTIQHGSVAAKALLGGAALLPLLLVAGYFCYRNSDMTAESVALMRRGNVSSIDISADGKTVIVGRTTGVVEIWNLTSKERSKIFAPDGLSGQIIGVSLVPDSQQLVLCTPAAAGGVDSRSGKLLWQVSGHSGTMRKFIASRDRKHVMVGSNDGVFSFWDAQTGNPIGAGAVALPQNKTQATELSNNGQMIAGVGASGPVTIWSTETAEELVTIDYFADTSIVDMEFSPDDQFLALSDSGGRLAIIDVNTLRPHQQIREPTLDTRGVPETYDKLRFQSHAVTLQGVLGLRQLFEINLDDGEVTLTEAGAPLMGNAFGTQPEGTLFAIGQDEGTPVFVFDRKDGQRKAVLDTD
jgi:HEAT repeat protein